MLSHIACIFCCLIYIKTDDIRKDYKILIILILPIFHFLLRFRHIHPLLGVVVKRLNHALSTQIKALCASIIKSHIPQLDRIRLLRSSASKSILWL